MEWNTKAGQFDTLQSMLKSYPPTHYEYGAGYNTPMQRVVIAGYGEGLRGNDGSPRILITPFYPQTDHYHNQRWGKWRALFVAGQARQPSPHHDHHDDNHPPHTHTHPHTYTHTHTYIHTCRRAAPMHQHAVTPWRVGVLHLAWPRGHAAACLPPRAHC